MYIKTITSNNSDKSYPGVEYPKEGLRAYGKGGANMRLSVRVLSKSTIDNVSHRRKMNCE